MEYFEILEFFGIPFKVTKITTKSNQGYYWAPKNAKNVTKQHNKLSFFARRAKKALGGSPKPSAGARSFTCLYILSHTDQKVPYPPSPLFRKKSEIA